MPRNAIEALPLAKPQPRGKGRAIGSGGPGSSPLRIPAYRRWLNGLPCVACFPGILANPWRHWMPGMNRSDADHLPTIGKGLALKSPDEFEIPLCRGLGTRDHHGCRAMEYRAPHAVWNTRDDEGRPHVLNPYYAATVLLYFWRQGPPAEVGI